MNEIVVQFEYENEKQQKFCEDKAQEIIFLGKKTVANIVQMGRCLNEVKATLPHGKWLPWLNAYFGWTADTARQYMKIGAMAEQVPEIAEFGTANMVLRFAELPDVSQRAVIAAGAYNRADEFERVALDAAMREHLADNEIEHDRRYGDVYQAIKEASLDPVLAPVAKKLYEENREKFARLADRQPAEIDVETGIDTSPPPPQDTPSAQLVQEEKYWICEWVNGEWQPIAPVKSHVLLWPGPTLLVAFPETKDGPAAVAWAHAAEEAVCSRLNAKSIATLYGGGVVL